MIRTKEVDLRLSHSSDMDVCRLVIGRVNDEPEAMSTMDDDHALL